MNLTAEEAKVSAVQAGLDRGKAKVGGEERTVTKAVRKTKEGRERQAESEETRKREEALIQATLKQKNKDESDEEGWESVEEDYPHIKLDDLKDLEE